MRSADACNGPSKVLPSSDSRMIGRMPASLSLCTTSSRGQRETNHFGASSKRSARSTSASVSPPLLGTPCSPNTAILLRPSPGLGSEARSGLGGRCRARARAVVLPTRCKKSHCPTPSTKTSFQRPTMRLTQVALRTLVAPVHTEDDANQGAETDRTRVKGPILAGSYSISG